jgi:hypothetical protein
MIDLGGDNVPVERIEVAIADPEFNRDFRLEAAGPPDDEGPFDPFWDVHSDTWSRRAGEKQEPMVAQFNEVRASRLRLTVTDHDNPPLAVKSVKFAAPARRVVFARPESPQTEFSLYYGNDKALAPQYDFARNLPLRLDPPPVRASLGSQQANPQHVPEPLPFTERWPWLIYAVLGAVCVVLAGLIVSVGRSAIKEHDSREAIAGASPDSRQRTAEEN